ncbi:putative eukaryotic translation initiation factor 2-alpha kinase precursor [Trypanosoma grayi]|uniref:putative eukaryotic translation initiation factor 2-alpha kinase precursor n=1 Tax=Trypanosoma grayi TaxID=71804 RepID=UPI0004F42803|nr:putative eukaryotic translation initiation factor 2-alpha kinase precursor [Trypanosoma grayi]KEG08117.1 putative eukaryotic translation initiation factor 2-alpha kinase precursor [Trypanosoma grayi]
MPNEYPRITLFLLLFLLVCSSVTAATDAAVQVDSSYVKTGVGVRQGTLSPVTPPATTAPAVGGVALQYGFYSPDMVLLLGTNGTLAAHLLDSGLPMWSVDTGGSVMHAKIDLHATEDVVREDPLAVPFVVEGDMLFTRRRFASQAAGRHLPLGSSANHEDGQEDKKEDLLGADNIPLSPAHPHYFMNLSTLIRRQHMRLGGTDIYVVTSAQIMDISSHTGKLVFAPNSLLPHLHIVRYNITVHAWCRGMYSWQISMAQYRLSEGSLTQATGCVQEEGDPRRVSRVLQDLLQKENSNGGHEPTVTPDSRTTGEANLESAVDVCRKSEIAQRLTVKEMEKSKYALWNKASGTALWPTAVNTIDNVAAAFICVRDYGGVKRVPVYRLQPSVTAAAIITTGKTTTTASIEGVKNGNHEAHSISNFLSDRPWTEHSSLIRIFEETRDGDIAADELEARELQNSMQECSWVYGCSAQQIGIPNHSPTEEGEWTEPFQLVPQIFILWSYTSTRRTVFIAFHVLILIISLTLACFGVVPRRRLQNAWAQVDALQNDIRNSSRPGSAMLAPVDISMRSEAYGIFKGVPPLALSPFQMPTSQGAMSFASPTHPFSLDAQNVKEGEGAEEEDEKQRQRTLESDGVDVSDTWWKCSGGEDDSSMSEKQSTGISFPTTNTTAPPQLFQQHFNVLKKVGHGAEGSVFCVEHRVTGAKYAIKAIRIHVEDQQRCVREAVLHSSLDFPNVVRFFYSWIEHMPRHVAEGHGILNDDDTMDTLSIQTEDSFYTKQLHESVTAEGSYSVLFIQMEYFQRGTLADFFATRNGFSRQENLEHLIQITEGLRYLHQQRVVHRDLKPTNIFVSDSGIMKIGDFGLAKRRGGPFGSMRNMVDELTSNAFAGEEERSVAGGSPLYCSPEQLRGDAATAASDIYSLGVVAVEFYCLFTTQHERFRTLGEARHGVFPVEMVEEFPQEVELFRGMLREHREGRPSIDDVYQTLRRAAKEERSSAQQKKQVRMPSPNVEEEESEFLSPLMPRNNASEFLSPLMPRNNASEVLAFLRPQNRQSISSLDSTAAANIQ